MKKFLREHHIHFWVNRGVSLLRLADWLRDNGSDHVRRLAHHCVHRADRLLTEKERAEGAAYVAEFVSVQYPGGSVYDDGFLEGGSDVWIA
jgi:hypothetical protein